MKVWVYLDGRQQGPFEFEQLADLPITPDTKVWFEGLPKWYPAGALEQMQPLFDGTFANAGKDTAAQSEQAGNSSEEAEETIETVETVIIEESRPEPKPAPGRYAPGQPHYSNTPDVPCPPTYLGWSVFLMICCCSPLSLAALVASICTTSYYHNGKLDQARKASEVAVWLVMTAFALGAIPALLMAINFG